MKRLAVVCVLKSGGVYTIEWVQRLKWMVSNHLQRPFDFICLTDTPFRKEGIICEPLTQDLPGFWSKLELFIPGQFDRYDRVLFLDLDVLIQHTLTPIVDFPFDRGTVRVLKGESKPRRVIRYQSSVMVWDRGAFDYLWKGFSKKVLESWYGDQDFMGSFGPDIPCFPDGWVHKLESSEHKKDPIVLLCIRPKNNELVQKEKWAAKLWGVK